MIIPKIGLHKVPSEIILIIYSTATYIGALLRFGGVDQKREALINSIIPTTRLKRPNGQPIIGKTIPKTVLSIPTNKKLLAVL